MVDNRMTHQMKFYVVNVERYQQSADEIFSTTSGKRIRQTTILTTGSDAKLRPDSVKNMGSSMKWDELSTNVSEFSLEG
jgi:hypothetical protein